MQVIHWYPGHMAKAKRELNELIKYLDLILEVRDARLPKVSHNSDLEVMLGKRPNIIILNKIDLADPSLTSEWTRRFNQLGLTVTGVNGKNGAGMKEVWNLLEKHQKNNTTRPTLRIGVIGIPNVGKSSVLNRLLGTGSAKTGNLPGITRGKQWVKREGFEVLDTPGLLPPKIINQEDGMKLALIGTIREEIIPVYDLALFLLESYGDQLFNWENSQSVPIERLEWYARKRGFLGKGGLPDLNRAAGTLLKEFRDGRIGRITLEVP